MHEAPNEGSTPPGHLGRALRVPAGGRIELRAAAIAGQGGIVMSGSLVHFEIPSRDTGRAKAFWGGVFDWSFNDPGMGMEYWMTRTGENQGGAIFAADQPGVIVYFDTDDIDATIARIQELGG